MKIFLVIFLLCYATKTTSLYKPIQCEVGKYERSKFNAKNNKIALGHIDSMTQHIDHLIKNESSFRNLRFISINSINDSTSRDSVIFENGACIKLILDDEKNVISTAFLSQNYRVDWHEMEILIKLIAPFSPQQHWHSSDIYKMAVNTKSAIAKQDHRFYLHEYNQHESHGMYLLNKFTDKLTIFLYKL